MQFYPHPNRPEHWVVSLADIQKGVTNRTSRGLTTLAMLMAISPFFCIYVVTGDELLLDYGEDYWKDIDEAEKNAQHEDEVVPPFPLLIFFILFSYSYALSLVKDYYYYYYG